MQINKAFFICNCDEFATFMTMQDSKNFVIYKSSAGSGKTFTLVKEYLSIALADEGFPNKTFNHILAITFTKKAAHEMKERILLYLNEISSGKRNTEDVMVKLLCENLLIDYTTLQKRCHTLQSSILHRYADFSVTTIDSFSYRIIKSFEFELQLPGGFEIESDKDYVIDLCIAQLLDKTGEEEQITKVLLEYIDQSTEDEKNWDIQKNIFDFGKKALKEDNKPYYEKLQNINIDEVLDIRKKIDKRISKFQNEIKQLGSEAFSLINKDSFKETDFHYGNAGFYGFLRKLNESSVVQIIDVVKDGLNSNVKKSIAEDKWLSTKISNENKQIFSVIETDIKSRLVAINNLLEEQLDIIKLNQKVMSNIFNIALINQLNTIIQAYKTQNNAIFISEFNQLISKVIQEEPVPFIYEKLGDKYRYYLIDEFQDTSTLQFTNLLPLIDNSLSQGYFNMLVGDGKQAIYRWREGNVELFSNLPNLLDEIKIPLKHEKEFQLHHNYKKENLTNNFRSKKEIIQFNNLLYDYLSNSELLNKYPEGKNIYADLQQDHAQQKNGGYVSLTFFEKKKTNFDEENEATEEDPIKFQKCVSTIAENIEDGYQYKDIAIICRSNREAVDIAEYLKENKIPIVSNDALRLWNNDLVKFIIHVFQFLLQPQDKIIGISILKYLCEQKIIAASFEALVEESKEKSIQSILKQYFPNYHSETLSTLPIEEMGIYIYDVFKLHTLDNGYFNYFLNELLAYKERYSSSLIDFLDWWEEKLNHLFVKIPEGKNAVTIITIHRSKGLQFPVVIMPFANWKTTNYDDKWIDIPIESGIELETAYFKLSKPEDGGLLIEAATEEMNKQNLDHLNMLYVATTRAMDRLYMMSDLLIKPSFKNISGWLLDMAKNQSYFKEQQLIFGERKPLENSNKNESNLVLENENVFRFQSNLNKIILKKNSESIWDENYNQEIEFGNKVHYLLSFLLHIDDLDKVLADAVNKGIIKVSELTDFKNFIGNMFSNPLSELFFNQVDLIKTEQEILLENNDLLRLDRICIDKNNDVKILDYKTGEKNSKYHHQLKDYSAALKALGYKNVKSYLLYTKYGEYEEVI
jgi:ATP-dependent exoDNAse (exonuclease V) beta subunit